MNSLSYLSRQFDVLASPRTPPSTPVSETAPLLANGAQAPELKRVRTWSTKSFLILPPVDAGSSSSTLKRSFSSPAEVNPISPAEPAGQPPPTLTVPVPPKRPLTSSLRRPSVSSSEKAVRPRTSEGFFRHLFFVRVILLLWNAICSLWRSITRRGVVRVTHEVAVEDGSSDEEKETEDERKEKKLVILEPPSPPIPLVTPPALPASPVSPLPPLGEPPIPPQLTPSSSLSEQSLSLERTPDPSIPPPSTSDPVLPAVTLRASPQPQAVTRSANPASGARKLRERFFPVPKTLVLDLDETLIHSSSRPISSASSSGSGMLGLAGFGRRNKGAGHVVEVVLGGKSTMYHVYKRPFADYFLRQVSKWYTLVIFTASMKEYADPVIDWLDAGRGILDRRFFRESCTQLPNGSYTKDLSIVEQDLSRVCLIDNSPICYTINEANGIPIEGWTHDPHDEALLDLLPVLDSLRFTSDVRRVLGIRGFS
ncbi:hypothetical protein CERSUDRAFT_149311 [Gelatoporia subvermispora B]|uniref:FCP1 homology domain-containing protein n=1 Tax=Ceriporiopsis subvermispora (strain B) TaxID=914234 RepID=M2QUU2_CERS8|nr:hypothetical protein CERSUDRAFT_149311 [Gelatoporia subvermispora B]